VGRGRGGDKRAKHREKETHDKAKSPAPLTRSGAPLHGGSNAGGAAPFRRPYAVTSGQIWHI